MNSVKPLKIGRVGGSLDIRLPPAFIHANNLKPGDYVIVDLTRFKILRAEDFELLGREAEPVPEKAA